MSGSPFPVVLIPGWLDSAGTMKVMAKFLKQQGFSPLIISPQPSDGSAPIEILAVQALAEIEAKIGAKAMFDLVGFSMGGLIGRVMLHWLGVKRRIRRFVTISTPHQGLFAARFTRRPALRQMKMNSPFLHALNRHLDDLAEIPFLSIWTPLDLMVIPPHSSVLPVGASCKVLNPAHAWMVYDPRVQRRVADFLGSTSP